MTYLADTHAIIWFLQNSPALSANVGAILSDRSTLVAASVVSIYEVDYKVARGQLGRLPLSFSDLLAGMGFNMISVTARHTALAASLDLTYRDPWDRIIAAQAISEGVTVLTRDPALQALGATVLW